MPYGSISYGRVSWGELPPMSDPEVSWSQPTAEEVVTATPLTADWAYSHPCPQGSYRFRVQSDDGTETLYDTGWVSDRVHVLELDPGTIGLPGDSTDVSVIVTVRTIWGERFETVSERRPFQLVLGVPTVVIVSPDGADVAGPQFELDWTFSDSQGGAQARSQYQLLAGGLPVLDVVTDSDGTGPLTPDYILSDGVTYTVRVRGRNVNGIWSEYDEVVFAANIADPSAFPLVTSVGRLWEVAINGVGYMLADKPGTDQAWRRTTVQLESPRFATGETPFSEAMDRYVLTGFSSWRGGSGQLWQDRPDSAHDRYFDSLNVNPFEEGQLSLLPDVDLVVDSAHDEVRAVTAGVRLVVQTDVQELTTLDDPEGTPAVLDFAAELGADEIVDLASDGQYWYAAVGTGVYRGTTAVPGAPWSTEDASTVSWAGQRLCVTYPSSGSTPNVWDTLALDGTPELVTPRLTLDPGWTIGKSSGNQGLLWFPAYSTARSVVYAWVVGSDEDPWPAWELPPGERATSVYAYQGLVYILSDRDDGTSILYRASSDDTGALSPEVVTVDLPPSLPSTAGFGGAGRFVFHSWPRIDTDRDGIGCIDVSSGGACRWLNGPGAGGEVRSIGLWQGRTWFSVDEAGVYLESTAGVMDEGWLETSQTDKNSSMPKLWDEALLQTYPMQSGESVALEATFDGGLSWSDVGTLSTGGQTAFAVPLDERSQTCALRVTLGATGGTSPGVTLLQVRGHASTPADEVLRLPINCFDDCTDLIGQDLPGGPGTGWKRYLRLAGLKGSRVKVQDIDWPLTAQTHLWEMVSVDADAVNLREAKVGRASQGVVATALLRRRAE